MKALKGSRRAEVLKFGYFRSYSVYRIRSISYGTIALHIGFTGLSKATVQLIQWLKPLAKHIGRPARLALFYPAHPPHHNI